MGNRHIECVPHPKVLCFSHIYGCSEVFNILFDDIFKIDGNNKMNGLVVVAFT